MPMTVLDAAKRPNYVARDFEAGSGQSAGRAGRLRWPGIFGQAKPRKPAPEQPGGTGGGDEDLERRRLQLEATLATRRPASRDGKDAPNSGDDGLRRRDQAFQRVRRRDRGGCRHRLGDRPLGRHFALGIDRLSPSRLCCGRSERAAVGRNGRRARVEGAARGRRLQVEDRRLRRRTMSRGREWRTIRSISSRSPN